MKSKIETLKNHDSLNCEKQSEVKIKKQNDVKPNSKKSADVDLDNKKPTETSLKGKATGVVELSSKNLVGKKLAKEPHGEKPQGNKGLQGSTSAYHVPIMADEIIDALRVTDSGLYFDGTLGGGGHSLRILQLGGRLIATDRDGDAIEECKKRFAGFEGRYTLIRGNFKNAKAYLQGMLSEELIRPADSMHDKKATGEKCPDDGAQSCTIFADTVTDGVLDGALLDLGISSHQIDTPERGMSYRFDAKLDMRMDLNQHLTAEIIVNEFSEDELIRILFDYGEERYARRIVGGIVKERAKHRIQTTGELVEIITKNVPGSYRQNPAMRTFQALRIEVNNELRGLDSAITEIFSCLKSGARMCVLSFHSLEDRIVKQTFAKLAESCICDKSLPICVCNHKAEGRLLGKHKAGEAELKLNSRSSSATLRIIEKI